MVVWAGNQNPRRTQTSIASALGVPINKVDARVRRVGGAYGGKLNAHLPTCVVAAVAARKMRAPVAVHHERCDDMSSGGHRAPVSATWSCAIDPASGVINSCHMHLEYDSGCVDGASGDLGIEHQRTPPSGQTIATTTRISLVRARSCSRHAWATRPSERPA